MEEGFQGTSEGILGRSDASGPEHLFVEAYESAALGPRSLMREPCDLGTQRAQLL